MKPVKKRSVYYIKNKYNGRVYVGSTVNVAHRKSTHFSTLRHAKHKNRRLQKDFNRYGEAAFEFVLVGTLVDEKTALKFEQSLIDGFESIYNILPKAGKARGRVYTAVTLKRMSEVAKGRKFSKKALDKAAALRRGKKTPEETRRKMSESHRRRYESGEGTYNSKVTEAEVREIHRKLNEGESREVIAEEFGIAYSTVCAILRGDTWRMVYEEFNKIEGKAI